MKNTKNNFIDSIGNTPLIKLKAASEITGCNIYGKAEYLNPGGSVKDRAALALIKDAEEKKLISKGGTIVEGTAGNTGIGLCLIGNSVGYKTVIVMNDNQTQEKKDMLKNIGADLRLVPPKPYKDDGNYVKVAGRLADELKSSNNHGVVWANQFDNTANSKGHYETTGPEIWEQTNGRVTHFVAGLGTTGTFVGTSRFLQKKGVHCVSVEPNTPMHGLEGWKHMETAIVPKIYDKSVADDTLEADTARSYELAKAASKHLGLMLSPSAAANLDAAMQLSDHVNNGVIVTVFADNAMKYLTDAFWNDNAYNIENPFC